jgi:hypothetical protein
MKLTAKELNDRDHNLMIKETRRKTKELRQHQMNVEMYNKKVTEKTTKKSKVDVLA